MIDGIMIFKMFWRSKIMTFMCMLTYVGQSISLGQNKATNEYASIVLSNLVLHWCGARVTLIIYLMPGGICVLSSFQCPLPLILDFYT